MRKNRKQAGFTLAELLIVVAIIGVLVAISIPIFSNQLEKAREATDMANIRGQYAEVVAAAIEADKDVNKGGKDAKVTLEQKKDGWQSEAAGKNMEGVYSSVEGKPAAGGSAWVEYDSETQQVSLHYEGGSGSAAASAGQQQAQARVTAPKNASEADKKATELVQKAYAGVVDATKAYIEEHKDSATHGLAKDNQNREGMNYRVYLMQDDGSFIEEGDSGTVKHADYKQSIPKMSSPGKVVVDEKEYSWKANQSVQLAYRENGTVEISIISENGDGMWGN